MRLFVFLFASVLAAHTPFAALDAQIAGIVFSRQRANHTASGPVLHVGSRWNECSIRLSAGLSQGAFRQFTREAGLLVYFRPLSSARPLGKGRFEIAAAQWKTGIDQHDSAWNDTFVHPDSTHYLFEGDGLQFPGLTARVGVSDRVDVGVYYTRNPMANYGFVGAQVQYALPSSEISNLDAAVRLSAVQLFGPDDVDLSVLGAEVLGSRTFALNTWLSIAPYAGASGFVATGRESSAVVDLNREITGGLRGMLGAEVQLFRARVAAEYNVAAVNSFNLKISFGS